MTCYSYGSLQYMLDDILYLEGIWSEIPLKKCEDKACFRCSNTIGFCFISCMICSKKISQCNLLTLHGICRVREDHNTGYAAAFVCMDCFPKLNNIITDVRLSALPPIPRSVYEPLRKWFLENWNFFQQLN